MASVADLAELKASHPMLDAVIDEQRGRQIRIGDHWLADFASCNYLGFDLDQEIIDAVPEYLARWGTHPSWSRLLGSPVMYEQIEAKVTELLGCEDTLLLPTITHIHMSVIPVLAGSGVIFLDNRAHKTIYDGAMMARGYGATVVRFRHDDHQHLEELLKVCKVTPRVIAMDGVNSMTGNAPDIGAFARLAREHDALLYVDDAHGFGVIGERSPDELCDWGTRGNGVVCHQGESYDNVIFVAGFSKSYSSLLSFLALPTRLKDVLKVAAPPYLYSGPSPVASLATTLVGLEVNDKRGDVARYEIFRKTDRVLGCLTRARHLHAQPLRLPGDRGAARPARGHRRRRPLPLRPGHLRDARRVSPRPEERGRVPDPGDRREHRRRDRASLRGARRDQRPLRPAARRPRAATGERAAGGGPAVTKGPVAKGLGNAEALSAAGEYASALQELDGIVASEPSNPAVHTARGWALENLGPERLGDARAAYEEALRLNAGAMWAKEGLANVLRRMGSTAEADQLCVEVIDEGTRRYEEEEDLRELVGWCELRLGRYDDAVRTLREALRRDGRWIAVRFDLALALLCAGDRVRAFLEYSRGVHQAVNGGVERLRGIVSVAIDDLEECLAERPALATTREAIAARNLLASTLPALPTDTRVG